MQELMRSNEPVRLSWAEAVLKEAGIPCLRLDEHMSVLEGSIGAIPRRLMVMDEDLDEAHRLLREAEMPDAG